MRFGVVILAAGASRRLGRPKVLVRRAGKTLLELQVRKAERCGARWIGVTLGCRYERTAPALRGLPASVIRVPHWRSGMGTSICAAARAAPAQLGLVFMAADQWQLTAADLARLARGAGRKTRAAGYAGIVGIPAFFPPAQRIALQHLRGERGARVHLRQAVVCAMPHAGPDLDTTHDLCVLRAAWPLYRSFPR